MDTREWADLESWESMELADDMEHRSEQAQRLRVLREDLEFLGAWIDPGAFDKIRQLEAQVRAEKRILRARGVEMPGPKDDA